MIQEVKKDDIILYVDDTIMFEDQSLEFKKLFLEFKDKNNSEYVMFDNCIAFKTELGRILFSPIQQI